MIYAVCLTTPMRVRYLWLIGVDGARQLKRTIPAMATQPPKAGAPAAAATDAAPRQRRKAIAQTDIPSVTVDEAMRVPRALGDDYAFQPSTPLEIARSVRMQPGSGPFRTLLGAAAAYGFTEGSAWAERISITPIGRRAIRPTVEGDDLAAKREAFLRPRVIVGFLKDYNTSKVPRDEIARNVLAEKYEIPVSEAGRVFKQIIDDARRLGLLTDIEGVEYVQLAGATPAAAQVAAPAAESSDVPAEQPQDLSALFERTNGTSAATPATASEPVRDQRLGRAYISHGKNNAFVELLTKLVKYVELEPVVSVQKETVSLPLTEKVIGDMRSCGAAIIHVDAERRLQDADGAEQVVLNENVLIEIGAAVALYGKRFILLVGDGVTLPSNLQGLYQVRYEGEKLDAEAGMRVLDAIHDFKNHPLP